MHLRRIVISLHDQRRVILYPEGGLELEAFVEGPGWVLDNDAHVPEGLLAALLRQAANLVGQQATREEESDAQALEAMRAKPHDPHCSCNDCILDMGPAPEPGTIGRVPPGFYDSTTF